MIKQARHCYKAPSKLSQFTHVCSITDIGHSLFYKSRQLCIYLSIVKWTNINANVFEIRKLPDIS